ncbi:hypothetical protein EDB85DRAFT_1943662 [Lactarius pseudohatsudake]|nr:hypothetical protein EDB85DRAFT_1943662 [Lactarius pseudohatsudake]
MTISIPTFLSYLFLMGSAYAQVSAPNCTDSSFAWSFNSLQQNPCWVTAYLAATCNNGAFSVPTLPSQQSYHGPTETDKGDICKCNTVVYNLISACDACQGEPWTPYSTWSFNCTTKATAGTFPNPVPAGTRVPRWAYIDSSIGDNWNISTAQLVGDSPEVTDTPSIVPTSTSTAAQSTSTSNHSSNAGAIAGGVVGGVVGAALIVGVVVWFGIRRRRARSSPPSMDFQGGEKDQLPLHPPKLYDPSDPTTFPSKEYLPVSNQVLGSTNHQQPIDSQNGGFGGLPEI